MKQAWIEKAEQYLDNEMSATERSLFEQEMAANEELSFYVDLYREIETVMEDDEKNGAKEDALKNSLGKLNAVYFNKEVKLDPVIPQDLYESPPVEQKAAVVYHRDKRKTRYWLAFAAAAATIGVIAIAITWFSQNEEAKPSIAGSEKPDTGKTTTDSLQRKDSPNLAVQNNTDSPAKKKQFPEADNKKQEELFAANFEPDDVPDVIEGPLEDAFNFYANKNYSDAAQEFSTADRDSETRGLQTDPKRTAFYADYYAGISYLEQADNTNAILKLKSAVTESHGELFSIKAEWYLALAYLKTGELTKANELFEKIAGNKKETVYRSKAARLLAALKQ